MVHRLGVTKIAVISNALRVTMRFFMFKYLVISSLCAKSFKSVSILSYLVYVQKVSNLSKVSMSGNFPLSKPW